MNRLLDQRYAIKLCFELDKTASGTHEMIKSAYGDDAMDQSSVSEWHILFREGREQIEDDEPSGRPSTSKSNENLVKVKNLLSSDGKLSVRMISEHLNLQKTTVHVIVTKNLGIRKVCAKLVPKVLTDEPKDRCVKTCQKLFHCVRGIRETSHGFSSMTRRQSAKAPNGTPPTHLSSKKPG